MGHKTPLGLLDIDSVVAWVRSSFMLPDLPALESDNVEVENLQNLIDAVKTAKFMDGLSDDKLVSSLQSAVEKSKVRFIAI